MLLKELRKSIYHANMMLQSSHLVLFTWGNVSGIDRNKGLVVIKPSGVPYEELTPENMVVVRLSDGKVVDGSLSPSSDTDTHLELYRKFPNIGGVVHTHSIWATSFAQANMEIPCKGTTHADYFYGNIPCTRHLTKNETMKDYELNIGKVIVETFHTKHIKYDDVPAVLIASHGPFVWGKNPNDAVHNAIILENVAEITHHGLCLPNSKSTMPIDLINKHYYRKHGKNAYYGQKK